MHTYIHYECTCIIQSFDVMRRGHLGSREAIFSSEWIQNKEQRTTQEKI